MKKMLSLVGAAMLLAPCSAVMAQQYFVRVGGAHISPHSTASDVAGPMLPPPPSGIGLEVQSASTLYFTVARSINDNLEVEFAAGYPPHPCFDRQALARTASACAGVPGAGAGPGSADCAHRVPELQVRRAHEPVASLGGLGHQLHQL